MARTLSNAILDTLLGNGGFIDNTARVSVGAAAGGNLALKMRKRKFLEKLVEKTMDPHEYFAVGKGAVKALAARRALAHSLQGALIGRSQRGLPGIVPGAAAGAVAGAIIGAKNGALLGFGLPGGVFDAVRNINHVNKVRSRAKLLRNALGVAGVGATGAAGLAAYRKVKEKK